MARIDVTELLLDPDFVSSLVCERNATTVGSNGRASQTTTNISFIGVVTSDKGAMLQRIAAGERIEDSISIITKFGLRVGGVGYTADVVQFNGKRYTVAMINDYSHMGAGFIEATADLIPLSG